MNIDSSHTGFMSSELSLQNQLEQLSQEFDCLGLPTINVHVDVLDQLVSSIFRLITLYRKTLGLQKNTNLQEQILRNENSSLQKLLDKQRTSEADKESDLIKRNEEIRRKESTINTLNRKNETLSRELEVLKIFWKNKENEFNHKVTVLKLENQSLRESLGEDIGKYKSVDATTAEVMIKYKAKESIYEDTIKKLQMNNEHLLNEVLNLKEEVMIALCRRDLP